jgi:hypothetical protein
MMNSRFKEVSDWYHSNARLFLNEHVPGKIEDLDKALERIAAHDSRVSEELAICFLGDSGIGKSTLINALVAGHEIVLPAGGIGPLTALAMEVRFGEEPSFEAEYHHAKALWQGVIFGLERGYDKLLKESTGRAPEADTPTDLLDEDELDPVDPSGAGSDDNSGAPRLESWQKQAQLLVKGNQDTPAELPYLLDSLRQAAGSKRVWGTTILAEDEQRVHRLQTALAMGREKKAHRRSRVADPAGFQRDLDDHACGFLAPLIRTLHVRWPSPLLKHGIVLVDLPGVGIAGDVYKEVTRTWINERAKAVVLVVGRAGLTQTAADLLRTSEFLTRLLFSRDDRALDPVVLAVAMSHVDDVAETEWAKDKSRKKAVHLAEQCELAKAKIRQQLRQELNRVWESGDESVRGAQREVTGDLCEQALVFPVSAPEYRRVLSNHEDDRPFIQTVQQSGIPDMQVGLETVVRERREDAARVRDESIDAFCAQVGAYIQRVRAQAEGGSGSDSEIEELIRDLEQVLSPLRKEFLVRQGQFREFLKNTMPQHIETLVGKAKDSARVEIVRYLKTLKDAHWGTLRAAVRREGTFFGARHINLPDDFARKFVEPVADVWGKSIIQQIRKRTKEFATDCERIVVQIADWCRSQGTRVPPRLLDAQIETIRADIKQIDVAGRDVINSLSEQVKNELGRAIQKPIQRRCRQFVGDQKDVGPGVKLRILDLFEKLANDTTDDAANAAGELLLLRFKEVESELRQLLKDLDDPLQNAADAIVEGHRGRLAKASARNREKVLAEVADLLASTPYVTPERAAEARV